MSFLTVTKTAAPSTPATNKSSIYVDTVTRRASQIDDTGAISTLTCSGLRDRNILTNGGFLIQQRFAAASTAIAGISTTTRAGQVSDTWAVTASVASNLNWQQVDAGAAPETGLLSRYYGSIIASSAGKKVMLSHWILNAEMSHLRGQQVRLSLKCSQKVGSEGQTFKLGLVQLNSSGTIDTSPAFLSGAWSTTTGVDPSWGTNLAAVTPDSTVTPENGTISGNFVEFTTTLAWKRVSGVWTVPTNCRNLVFVVFANATGGATDNISFAEMQLTQGEEIVDYVEPPMAETLARCQRRYCKSFPLTVAPAPSIAVATGGNGEVGIIGKAAATALAAVIQIRFPVRMWRTPSLTLFTPVGAGAVPYRLNGTTPAAQTAAATTGLLDMGAVVTATGDANGAIGDMVGVHYAADAEFIT
jgi:hypothetical protein